MSEPDKALDAHETAKPDEPTFTLQGGDPLAAVLVRLWSKLARLQTGRLSKAAALEMESGCFEVASRNRVTSERDITELLTRATAAEEVSWKMDDYLKGNAGASQPETPGEKFLTAEDKLDIYDLRRRGHSMVWQMAGDLAELHDALEAKGFGQDSASDARAVLCLIEIRNAIAKLTTIRGYIKQ